MRNADRVAFGFDVSLRVGMTGITAGIDLRELQGKTIAVEDHMCRV